MNSVSVLISQNYPLIRKAHEESHYKTPHVIFHPDHELHNNLDPHQKSASGLSDIILGGQDGLVNVLGVILGVAAATSDPHLVLVAGLSSDIRRVGFNGSSCLHLHPGRCRLLR